MDFGKVFQVAIAGIHENKERAQRRANMPRVGEKIVNDLWPTPLTSKGLVSCMRKGYRQGLIQQPRCGIKVPRR